MFKKKTRRFLQAVSILLTFAIFTGTFTAAAEATENYNTTHVWLIHDNLTETPYSDSIFNRYEDKNFETNTAEIFTYNESGEVDYTYSLSGSVGDATASLDLNFWHNTNDLGNAPYASAVAEGSETFLTETDGTNFMNSVYGFGIGWSLGLPQIEYINSSTAYFHNGEGKAYRIGAVAPETTENTEETESTAETTYKLCGFPYNYTIEKNIVFENEEDTEGTLQGFIGTDRYGNRDYFNRDGRFIKSEDASGTVLSTVTYNEDNLISTYSGEDYTLNFVRTEAEDETEEITVNMSSDIEETDEDGNTTTTTETETIHTFTITDGKLISVYEGEKDAEHETSTETDEENGVTITTTDTSENSVAFEYEAETSAILLDSEVDTIESDLSGMDLLLLKKVTVNSESSTTENYEAIDETNETAVAYATEQNETALNEAESNIECYEMTYSKGYKRFGRQSAVRVSRISEVVKTDSMVYSDVETHETKHYIFYDDEQRVLSVDVEKDGITAQQLVYCYTVGQNEFTVNCSHVVDIKNITHIEFDPIYFCGEIPSKWQELSYETTKNTKGQVVKYRYKKGPQYTYEYDEIGNISKIKFDKYTISYNNSGLIENFCLGNQALTDYSYESSFDLSLVTAIAYANGQRIVNEYDETNGNLLSISCGNSQRYTFTYDEENNITSVTDISNFKKTEYVETISEKTAVPTEETESEIESAEMTTDSTESGETTEEEPITRQTAFVYDIRNAESPVLMYSYDVEGDTKSITLDSVSLDFSTETEDVLNEEGEIESIKTTSILKNGTKTIQNENLSTAGGNITQTSVIIGGNNILTKKYERDDRARLTKEYAENDDSTSIEYVYFDENISQINGPYYTTNYLYDSWGQLIEVSEDHRYGRARRYNYDTRGNIVSIEGYDNALGIRGELLYTNYLQYNNYNWPDQLTSYNGREITYDASGNLLTYNGYTYNWDMGRQLTSITKTDVSQILYTYDEYGLRTSKTVNGVTTKFIYDTTLLKAEYTDDYSILFWYDENNSPIGFVYTDKTVETPISQTFIYEKNIFGDIKAIYDETGQLAVSYVFDEFGCMIDAYWLEEYYNIFQINPLLYRGYYFDYETGYYYLSTRYYNPNWGRFISPDDVRYIGASGNYLGINAYAYCEGNPVMYIDPNATAPQKYYIRKAEELKITKEEKSQIMSYAWREDSVGFPPKIVFTKYCEYKGKLTNKQTNKPYITYTYSKSSSWRGGTYWFTKYVFMKKKVKEWKKVVSYDNYYNPKLLNNIFTEALDVASNDSYAPDELSTGLSALSTILTLADKIYERSCSKVHRNRLSKYVEKNIEGKKDNKSVSLLMKYDTYLHSRKLFSKKYKTETLSSHWMY